MKRNRFEKISFNKADKKCLFKHLRIEKSSRLKCLLQTMIFYILMMATEKRGDIFTKTVRLRNNVYLHAYQHVNRDLPSISIAYKKVLRWLQLKTLVRLVANGWDRKWIDPVQYERKQKNWISENVQHLLWRLNIDIAHEIGKRTHDWQTKVAAYAFNATALLKYLSLFAHVGEWRWERGAIHVQCLFADFMQMQAYAQVFANPYFLHLNYIS